MEVCDICRFVCLHTFRILWNLSAFQPCILHSFQNITESQILQNQYRFPPNGCQVSHSGYVVMVERFVGSHVVYQCQRCLSVRDREKQIDTGDRQMNRTRERGSLWRFRQNTNYIPECHSSSRWVDSGFSRPNVGRYESILLSTIL